MATMKHTPGPWTIHPYSDVGKRRLIEPADGSPSFEVSSITIGSGDKIVADVDMFVFSEPKQGGYLRVDSEAELEANAALICAAPDLLHALKALLARAKRELVDPIDVWEVAFAEEAIQQAEGARIAEAAK